ncbi:MAG: hypothetical protein U5L96_13365 [Owenweeksia sp.]|nr:hypothetical protein [Owenweeksia sp.]
MNNQKEPVKDEKQELTTEERLFRYLKAINQNLNIQNQRLTSIKNNVQFFFWVAIISFVIAVLSAIANLA